MIPPLNPTLEQQLDETLKTLDILGCSIGALNLVRVAIRAGQYPNTLTKDLSDAAAYEIENTCKGLSQVCDILTKWLIIHGANHGQDFVRKGKGIN